MTDQSVNAQQSPCTDHTFCKYIISYIISLTSSPDTSPPDMPTHSNLLIRQLVEVFKCQNNFTHLGTGQALQTSQYLTHLHSLIRDPVKLSSIRGYDTSTHIHSLIRELVEAVKNTVLFVSYEIIARHRTYHGAGNLSTCLQA